MPAVTKPGNSDPDEGADVEKAEPTEATEPAETAAEPVEAAAEDTADAVGEADDKPADKSDESDEVEKPKQPTKSKKSTKDSKLAAKQDSGSEDLMAELEKAPPAPDEPEVKPRKRREKPVMPTAAEAASRKPELPLPPVVRYGFFAFVAAGLVWVANSIFLLINKDTLVNDAINSKEIAKQISEGKLSEQQVMDSTNFLLWAMLVLALVFGAFYTLFGYKSQDGLRRARVMLTVLAVISVLFHFLLFVTLFGQLSAFLALIGTLLMYLPSSNAYFKAHQGT